MKKFVFLLVLLCILFVLTEANKDKKEKRKWKKTKKFAKLSLRQENGLEKKHSRAEAVRNHHHKQKAKKWNKKNAKFSPKNQLAWLKFGSADKCGLKCGHGEICILGPMETKPMCVRKKDLKKSMKLFHRYQKKEMKAWRKFQKMNYKNVDDKQVFSKYEINEDMANKKKAHLMKHANKHHKKGKHMKKQGVPVKVNHDDECSTSLFAQMRTRMMGWFHLLHGQDHLAKKDVSTNIKHFHKHVSVKKELREHSGDRCECFKSAMWQFSQMDKNGDDNLDVAEMSVIEENSLEPCMQPYLTSCDRNADGKLSSDEWCCCFANVVAPCFKKLDEIKWAGKAVTYMPRCDKEGYYMREQCSGESKDKYKCWCVDYNGNELENTTIEGRAHCSKLASKKLKDGPENE